MHITLANISQLLGGLGMFLYGMFLMEGAIGQLAGRTFKLFLRRNTRKKGGAILSGALVTGVLQSSSVVTFMVLAFVGAGILTMRNALAVVLGANLGTTLDSWLVAGLGFHVRLDYFSMLLVAVAAGGVLFSGGHKKVQQVSLFILGFGFLFLGLEQMKNGMESTVKDFDFKPYEGYSKLAFVGLGFLLTAIIQSSSATIALTLSALSTGVFPLEVAAAVVIGAEPGTALKTILGSYGGNASKKRVAAGNIIFNIVTALFSYAALYPLLWFIREVIRLSDPLLILVCFQSLINLACIFIFLPVLEPFSRFLEKRFSAQEDPAVVYLHEAGPGHEDAMAALEKETRLFIHRVISLNLDTFDARMSDPGNGPVKAGLQELEQGKKMSHDERYERLKRAEGEIMLFYAGLHQKDQRAAQLVEAVRSAMYAAKGLRDVKHDRNELRNSVNEEKYARYLELRSYLEHFYAGLLPLFGNKDGEPRAQLALTLQQARTDYEKRMTELYGLAGKHDLVKADVPTLLNVNREFFSSAKAIIFALANYLLDEAGLEKFTDEIAEVPAW